MDKHYAWEEADPIIWNHDTAIQCIGLGNLKDIVAHVAHARQKHLWDTVSFDEAVSIVCGEFAEMLVEVKKIRESEHGTDEFLEACEHFRYEIFDLIAPLIRILNSEYDAGEWPAY